MLPPESFRTPIPMLTEDSPYKSDGGDTDVKQEAGFPDDRRVTEAHTCRREWGCDLGLAEDALLQD